MEHSGKAALLSAFDRLFERAVQKLNVECTPQEKDEAKQYFANRYGEALNFLDEAGFPAFSESAMRYMEAAIDEVPLAHVAGHLATGPLALQVREFLRALALRAAEQRLVEHLATQADDTYGGN